MGKKEKLFIQGFIGFSLLMILGKWVWAEGYILTFIAGGIMSLSFLALIVIYIKRAGFSIYSLAYFLFGFIFLGLLFKINHFPGGNELLIIAHIRFLVIGIIFLRLGFTDSVMPAKAYFIVLGSVTTVHFVAVFFKGLGLGVLVPLFQDYGNYFYLLILSAIKFYKIEMNKKADALVNLMLLVAITEIIIQLVVELG